MNKKLLFGIMSLAALAACTNDDFDSQQQVAEGISPIQFEVINNNASMRATMGENTVVWSAKDGDLFTLYHGAGYTTPAAVTGYQNATYKANAVDGGVATLTTPSVILEGSAIMVWPVDTTFSIKSTDKLSIKIPAVQGGKDEKGNDIIQYQIPYVSDLINIQTYKAYNEDATKGAVTAYNTAGKDRKYSVYMRPMASQLNLTADYAGSDATIAQLYAGGSDGLTGEDAVDEIAVSSVDLLTTAGGTTKFTTKIPLQFAAPTGTQGTNWTAKAPNHAWTQVTNFNVGGITAADQVDKLTTKHLFAGNTGGKFLILPQANIGAAGVAEGAVVVNTNYGKVIVAPTTFGTNTGKYDATEIADAWYRYAAAGAGAGTYAETETTIAGTGSDASKVRYTNTIDKGLAQVIDAFSKNTAATGSIVVGEPTGAKGTRYVKVLLKYLDMSDLHIKTDKQLRDAAKVWKKMNLSDVTVYLDGDATGKFEISQKTIEVINTINASVSGKSFKVMPCTITTPDEDCTDIVVTGGGDIKDMAFIVANAGAKANVVLKADQNWKWNGTVKVATAATTGINQFINKGTLTNNETKVLAITDNTTPATQLFSIPLINDGTWNVTAGTLRVQFNVTNNGQVNIAKNAQYRQDGQDAFAKKTIFTNEATDKPSRFGGDDSKIGKVENKGVFATIGGADINNYGLIEHADADAKTYISANQSLAANGFAADADFTANFDPATSGTGNKMGRINLPFSNKEEDNISVSAALAQGFISVTVTDADAPSNGDLNASVVGGKVNYVIVNGGIKKISTVSGQIKYVEFNQPNTEIEWAVAAANYEGLMVLSPVNIKLGTTIKIWNGTTPGTGACYLGADMYVGGTFNNGTAGTMPSWNGYYGNTATNFATKYITY